MSHKGGGGGSNIIWMAPYELAVVNWLSFLGAEVLCSYIRQIKLPNTQSQDNVLVNLFLLYLTYKDKIEKYTSSAFCGLIAVLAEENDKKI